jgi:hypothetical protein
MNAAERVTRGQRAAELLENPMIAEAHKHIEAECYRLFCETAPTDTETLAKVKAMQYMHGKYVSYLQAVVMDGKQAKLDLEWEQTKPKVGDRARSFFRGLGI